MTASSSVSLSQRAAEPQAIGYIADRFLHARDRSRTVTAAFHNIRDLLGQSGDDPHHTPVSLDAHRVLRVIDAVVDYENKIPEFLATIAPAVVAQAQLIETIAPGYESTLPQIAGDEIDRLVQPIFERAGLNDFIEAEELTPA